jgi:hypothetical protein
MHFFRELTVYLEKKHQNVPFGPVNAREKRVNHEHQKHVKEIDAKCNSTMDGIVGPVQRAAQSFSRTGGFVVDACVGMLPRPAQTRERHCCSSGRKRLASNGMQGRCGSSGHTGGGNTN